MAIARPQSSRKCLGSPHSKRGSKEMPTKQGLKRAIKEERANLNEDYGRRLVETVPKRLRAVIENKGDYTIRVYCILMIRTLNLLYIPTIFILISLYFLWIRIDPFGFKRPVSGMHRRMLYTVCTSGIHLHGLHARKTHVLMVCTCLTCARHMDVHTANNFNQSEKG